MEPRSVQSPVPRDHRTWLGVVRPASEPDGGVQLTVPLSRAEYDALHDACDRVKYLLDKKTIDFVCNNRDNFLELALAVGQEAKGHGTRHPEPDYWKAAYFDLQCSFTNVLDSVRLFLDHTTTRLARLHGSDSEQLDRFKGSCAAVFDSSPAYRLAYKLRDFVTHVGLPPLKFTSAAAVLGAVGRLPARPPDVAPVVVDLGDGGLRISQEWKVRHLPTEAATAIMGQLGSNPPEGWVERRGVAPKCRSAGAVAEQTATATAHLSPAPARQDAGWRSGRAA